MRHGLIHRQALFDQRYWLNASNNYFPRCPFSQDMRNSLRLQSGLQRDVSFGQTSDKTIDVDLTVCFRNDVSYFVKQIGWLKCPAINAPNCSAERSIDLLTGCIFAANNLPKKAEKLSFISAARKEGQVRSGIDFGSYFRLHQIIRKYSHECSDQGHQVFI